MSQGKALMHRGFARRTGTVRRAGDVWERAMGNKAGQHDPEQLVFWDSEAEPAGAGAALTRQRGRDNGKLQFNLGLLGPRLRAEAELQKTTMAALLRRAARKMFDEDAALRDAGVAPQPFEHSARNEQFHLRLPAAAFQALTARARAADMTRGEFVWWLLQGISPAALPSDHSVAVLALRESTDRLAAMSTDLRELLRLVTRVSAGSTELAGYQGRLRSLIEALLEHLKSASLLIEELRPYRRARW